MDKKISQLGATTVPVNADLFAIVQSGVTKKITYQNLKAAILNSASLTTGYVPFYNGTNLADSNLIHNSLFTSLKDTTYLQSENGLTTLNFNDGNGFSLDWSDVNTGGIFADNGKTQVYHSDIVDINATIVKIRKNLITSGTTDKTWIEFFTGDSCRITTDGGARNEGWLELTTANAGLFFAGYGIEIDANKVEISHDTQTTFNSPLYTFQQLTASTVPYLDASNNLVSSTITPTELGYLSGATSSIQTQLDYKVQTILKSVTDYSHTGDTNITKVHSALILANTFSVGDIIDVYAQYRKSGTAGNLNIRVYVNTTDDLTGATRIFQYDSGNAANVYYGIYRKFLIKSSTNTESIVSTGSTLNSITNSNTAVSSNNIDWTANQYLLFSLQLAAGADVGTLSGYVLKKE